MNIFLCRNIIKLIQVFIVITITGCAYSPNAYQSELLTIENNINSIADQPIGRSSTVEDANRYAFQLYQRASLTGRFEHFKEVDDAINLIHKLFGDSRELFYLEVNLSIKLHRLEKAKSILEQLGDSETDLEVATLAADIAIQEGRYKFTEHIYEKLVNENRNWQSLSRLAHYRSNTQQVVLADELYAEAEDLLSVKEMRHYSWIELQRGLLEFEYGHYDKALAHYRLADKAYPGYWLIQEHIAEVLAIKGDKEKALKLYRDVITETNNPEFVSALANLLRKDEPEMAKSLYQRAEALFSNRQSLYPEAAAGHIIDHWLHQPVTTPEFERRLLLTAEENHKLRPSSESKLILVKVMIRQNKLQDARELMDKILQGPWRTPEQITVAKQLGISMRHL